MKSKVNKRLLFTRFAIIALSIILQAVALWTFFYKAASLWRWGQIVSYVVGVLLLVHILNKDNAAVYKVPWIIICLLFPFAGAMCYITFGNVRLSRKQMKKFRVVYNEHNDEYYDQNGVITDLENSHPDKVGVFKYLKNVTSMPAYANTKIEYLPDGETYFAELLDVLKSARKYIFLEYFIIEEGKMWDEIHAVLLDKIAQGVKVYLMYDDIGSVFKISSSFYKKLRKEGIDARKFNKFAPFVSIVHNNRDHRKIAVIDGKISFTGGVNIADEYINEKHPFGRWLDSGVKVTGQATDSFVRLFIQLFNMSGEELNEDDFIEKSPEKFINDGYCIPFGDSPAPIEYEHIAEKNFLNTIYGAKKYVYFAAPYFIVDNDVRDALINAAKRGVDVRLIIPQIPDKKTIYVMTKYYCSKLLDAGVKIYLYRDGFVHSKTMLCDGELAFSGTVNLDFRSFVHHFECGIMFTNKDAVATIREDFDELFEKQCVIADKATLKLRWYESLAKLIITPFSPLI